MATPIEQLADVQRRFEQYTDPYTITESIEFCRAIRDAHEDIAFLLKTLEQRTDALQYAVGVVNRIARERGMDECMEDDCTIDHPRCAVRIAQAELAGRLGRWRT